MENIDSIRRTNLLTFFRKCPSNFHIGEWLCNQPDDAPAVNAKDAAPVLLELSAESRLYLIQRRDDIPVFESDVRWFEQKLKLPCGFFDKSPNEFDAPANWQKFAVFSSRNFKQSKLLGWTDLKVNPNAKRFKDSFCYLIEDCGFPHTAPFRSIVLIDEDPFDDSGFHYAGDGLFFYCIDDHLVLRRIVKLADDNFLMFSSENTFKEIDDINLGFLWGKVIYIEKEPDFMN